MSFRVGTDDSDLPSVPRAVARSLRLAYRAEPRLLVVSFVLMVLAWLPDAFGALWLKVLVDGIADDRGATITWASAGLALAAVGGWLLRTVGSRVEMRFRDRATIEIEAHVAFLQASVPTLEHHERPAYLDRLQLLRDQVFLLNHMYGSLMSFVGSAGRLAVTLGLLVSIHPALVLLGAFAVPTVVVSTRRATAERKAEERAATFDRLNRHLYELGTTAGPAKEIRVSGNGARLLACRADAWQAWYAQVGATRNASAAWLAAAWASFGAAYLAAVVFVASVLDATPGDVLLTLAAGANLSRYLGVTVGQTEFLRWTIDACQRLVWLEDFAFASRAKADHPAPDALVDGIRFENVSFTYPGTTRRVLEGIDLHLRAGTVVALVGENGAGKTTLVKLLCRMYDPTDGAILVDGVDLRRIRPDEWRDRVSGAFQDFFRFEYETLRSIGVGDLPRHVDRAAVGAAVERAGAGDVVDGLPAGLDTQLGATWSGGVELSIGQWQKVALARGFMREGPLVTVLDEPTAALDAETEHALFERYAAASRQTTEGGGITVLVSHRFSTVRMADLIVVLDGARVVEVGAHDELMAARGLYAELYEVQAAGYRS